MFTSNLSWVQKQPNASGQENYSQSKRSICCAKSGFSFLLFSVRVRILSESFRKLLAFVVIGRQTEGDRDWVGETAEGGVWIMTTGGTQTWGSGGHSGSRRCTTAPLNGGRFVSVFDGKTGQITIPALMPGTELCGVWRMLSCVIITNTSSWHQSLFTRKHSTHVSTGAEK